MGIVDGREIAENSVTHHCGVIQVWEELMAESETKAKTSFLERNDTDGTYCLVEPKRMDLSRPESATTGLRFFSVMGARMAS
jgi:hypothetical protein